MRRSKLILTAVVLLLGGAAAYWWLRAPAEIATNTKPSAPASAGAQSTRSGGSALKLKGISLTPRPFSESIVANGTLRADESVELQTEVNGKIISLNFEEGQKVSAGDVLVKIQDAPLQASLRRALARRELAGYRRDRLARLVRDGGVSQQDYDEAAGEVEVLDAEVELIRAEIDKTEIRAPFDGVVGLRFVSLGAYVNPATRIATLQRLSAVKIDFSVPERYVQDLRIGSTITFTVAGSTRVYDAEVYAVQPIIDIATRTVMLRARCLEPNATLVPGLFARVEFTVNQADDALMVPAISVIYGLDERFVFVARQGKADRVPVSLGARTDTQVQITQGLKAGDTVLVTGVQQLRAGADVEVELLPN